MNTTLIAISLGVATTVSVIAGDSSKACQSKETALERYGCYVGKGAHDVSDSVGRTAQRGYEGSKKWWGENKDEVKAKTMEIREKAEQTAKRTAEGATKFVKGLKSGWRR